MAGKTSKSKKAAPRKVVAKAKPAKKATPQKVAPKSAKKQASEGKPSAPKPVAVAAPAKVVPAQADSSVKRVVSARGVASGKAPVAVQSVSRAAKKAEDVPFEQAEDYRPEPNRPVELTAFLRKQKQKLEDLRDHLLDQMHDVSRDNLRAAPDLGGGSAFGQHMGDAGSDAYEKDFALSLLSQEQDSLYEIEEALKRLDGGTYGVCEKSGKRIPHERLEAIPWARHTVECQAEIERALKGRNKWESHPHFMDVAEGGEEEEEEESEEEPRLRGKEQQ